MERIVEYTHKAEEDIIFFKKTGQSKILKKNTQTNSINPTKSI